MGAIAGKDLEGCLVYMHVQARHQQFNFTNTRAPVRKDLIQPLLPAFSGIFCLPVTITANSDPETVSFENIQLSAQGAERQRKDVKDLADRTWLL